MSSKGKLTAKPSIKLLLTSTGRFSGSINCDFYDQEKINVQSAYLSRIKLPKRRHLELDCIEHTYKEP